MPAALSATARRGASMCRSNFSAQDAEMEQTLWEAVGRLAPLKPNFVSVTYGAGGSTRERTHATVKRILAETALTPAAHLTCVARHARRSTTSFAPMRRRACATSWRCAAIRPAASASATRRIRRLSPRGRSRLRHQAYCRCRGLRLRLSGEHPDSANVEADIDMLAAKVDAGRGARDHAILLRERFLLSLPPPRPRARHQ